MSDVTEHLAGTDGLIDVHAPREVLERRDLWTGHIMGLREDLVRLGEGLPDVRREYTTHSGAVAVVVMRGGHGAEEILLERQYRHPVGAQLWEIPAGLLDMEGESPLEAARRELAEEVDLEADRWDVLVDCFTSPGNSQESVRIFLARDVRPTGVSFPREAEEAELVLEWVALDEAVAGVLSGRFHNPSTVMGVLAAAAARARGWVGLRPADAHWLR